jgi:putative aldouronate transport system substrate-binding protein
MNDLVVTIEYEAIPKNRPSTKSIFSEERGVTMKKISRRDALKLIGLTAAGSTLAACTPSTPEPLAPAKPAEGQVSVPSPEMQEIKVSLWDIQDSFPSGDPDEIAKYVTSKFNVKFTPVNVGWGDADEKYNTWAASGQLPDIIGAMAMPGTGRYHQWISDGVVRSLPDTAAYPEINKLMVQSEVTAYEVNGKNYFLPRATYGDPAWWAMDRGLIVRKDWMEQLGISDPKTEEDYINMTVAFATKDPDGNGMADTAGFTPVAPWILTSQGWPGYGYTDGKWIKDSDGSYRQGISGEKTFRMMQFFKKMFRAGGLDPDFATLGSGQALDKFAAGKTGMLGRQASPKHLKAVLDAWVKVQPDKDFVDSIKLLHGPSIDGSYTRFSEMAYWSESYIEANVPDAKMEKILDLYNWLYSKEGMFTMSYGMEGKDYTIEGGNVKLLTPIDPETGRNVSTATLYPFTYAMGYLAAWTGDLLQYDDPSIPQAIRDMTAKERDHRVSVWKDPQINWAVQSIDVPEKQEMAAVTFGDDWVGFIMDNSNRPDEDIYQAIHKNWDGNGYAAAVAAVTKKAAELGLS